jgi:hypothetical protein
VDDRDKDLTQLFVRDLDEIPLPARSEWRRIPGKGSIAMRASRGLFAAGAVAAVLAVALIVGYQLNQRQQGVAAPSASPTASPSASSVPVGVPSPTGSPCLGPCGPTGATQSAPTSTGIYNDDFGFLIAASDTPVETVRQESGGVPFGTIYLNFAVSPDGKQLAFFVPDVNGAKLQIAPASDPNKAQTIATLSIGEQGAGVVWSNDASGLLYTTVFQKPDGSMQAAQVHTFDLRGTTSPNRLIFVQGPDGFILRPIAWDRSADVAAFGETGDGGFMAFYDVANVGGSDANVTRSKVPVRITMASVRASSDAKFVVAQDLDANGFTYWPLQTMSGAGHHPAESKYGTNGFAWRPGTHEIGFIGPSNQFWVCDVDKDNSLGCGHTLFSGVPDGANVRFFRADGSAVLLALRAAPGPGPTSWMLVRIGTDPKSTSGDRVTFEVPTALLGSVRLR